jgi:hypothetical protein
MDSTRSAVPATRPLAVRVVEPAARDWEIGRGPAAHLSRGAAGKAGERFGGQVPQPRRRCRGPERSLFVNR